MSQPSQSDESTRGQCPPSDLGGIGASTRPKGINFPTTNFSGKNQSFNAKWYDEFNWLEYSISQDAAFCYPYRMFTAGTGKSEITFTVVGFRDWKHASGKSGVLQNHDKCSVHKSAVVAWGQYKYGITHGKSVADQLETTRSLQIINNQHYLKAVAEVILLCALQEIALRGHIYRFCKLEISGKFYNW